MTNTTSSTLATEYAAAISALDVDRYVATFADDAVAHEPVGTEAWVGKAGVRQFFENTSGLFANINFQFTFVETIGDAVALKWQANGMGKNGRSVSFEGIDIWQLDRAGKIRQIHAYWDAATVVAKLTENQ